MSSQERRSAPTQNETLNPSHARTGRLTLEQAMMFVAVSVSAMSTCRRRAVGCVLTRDRHIVATGYNGAPRGLRHCLDDGCLIVDGHCARCTHAEANACLRCESADTAFCTDTPCLTCLKLMIQKGVARIHCMRPYRDPATDVFVRTNFAGGEEPIVNVGGPLAYWLDVHRVQLEEAISVLGDV